jgi:hypothetical protein
MLGDFTEYRRLLLPAVLIFIIIIGMTTKHKLTADETDLLVALDTKLDHVRDVVKGVVKGYQPGVFLYGEGGTSKSYTVLQTLQQMKCKYILHNTRITGRGLVDALEEAPAALHFIEDAETLMGDKTSYGVLRSACWSQSTERPMVRPVTWRAFKTTIRFDFTGGLIIISNVNLADSIPEIRAIKTRINVLSVDVSPDEIKALMKKIALAGYAFGEYFLPVDECMEVRQFVIEKLAEMHKGLDIRLMINGFKDFIQWQNGDSKTHWEQLVLGRMTEQVQKGVSRKSVNVEKQKMALEIRAMKLPGTDLAKVVKERMGISVPAYYRALRRTV